MRRRTPGALLLAALLWSVSPSLLQASADTSLPGVPTNVSAQAGTLSATVQWTPADSNATSYTVTSNPRGITATVDGTSTSATVTGLAFATAYTFTVAGTNGIGTGPSSAPSNPVTPDAPGGPYHQGAARVLANTDVTAGAGATFNIGEDRVHAPGLSAVVLNVTASGATQASVLQLLVEGQVEATIPIAPGLVQSSLTVISIVGQMNPAVVQLTAGQAHVEIDFVGFFTGARTVRDDSGLLHMINTATLIDAPVAADSSTDVRILSQGDVPASGVGGVLLNVTAVNPTAGGSFEVLPSGSPDAGITTLGFAAGQASANRAIVPLPANGTVTLVDHGAAAEARIDVLGWFTDGTDATAVGSLYSPLSPTRLVDTAAGAGPVPVGGSLTFPVWDQGGAAGGSDPAPTTTALLEVTAVSPSGAGSIVFAGASAIDFAAGQTASGSDLVQLQFPAGTASLTVLGAATNVTVDLIAFFSGDLIVPGSTKVLTAAQLAGITNLGADLTITFAPGTPISPPVFLNDVIAAGTSPTTPDGLMRRVLSISTTSDGSTVLGTRIASVPEAVTSFNATWTYQPPTTFGMSQGAHASKLALAASPMSTNPLPPPPNTSIVPNAPTFGIVAPNGVSVDLSNLLPGLLGGSGISVNDLEVQPHIFLAMALSRNGKFTMQFALSAGERASIDITLQAQLQFADFFPKLLDRIFAVGPPVDLQLGLVPLVFQPFIEVKVEIKASLSGGIVISLGLDRYEAVSGGYDGNHFFMDPFTYHNYLSRSQEFHWRPSEQLTVEADLHVYPHLKFEGGLAQAGVEAIPVAKFTVDPFAPHWWDLSLSLCIQGAFNLNLIFLTKDNVILPTCIVLDDIPAPGPLLGITLSPSPATVHRSQTQHFHASIPLSFNGVVWSVDESGGGTLSNMTPFDVDYTAPKPAGTYHLRAEAVDDPTSAKEVDITVPPDPPSDPINVVAALTTSTSAIVGWTVPADDGGVPLKTYVVTASPGGTIATINAPGGTATFNRLQPATQYTFSVAAINGAGLTGASAVSNSITTPPAGPMSVVPTTIAFGSVNLGQSSQPQTVQVTAGGTPLVISTVSLAGANPGEFGIQSDLCSGQTLQPGGSCSFAVVYTPTQQISAGATVTINDSDPTSPQTVALTGSSPVQAVSGVLNVFDIQMVDAQTGYALEAGRGSEIVKTTDGGTTWTRLIMPAFDQVNDSASGSGYTLRFVDANHGFVNAYHELLPAGQRPLILATSDGGQTWREISLPAGVAPGSIWFSDALHGWFLSGVAGPPPPPGSLFNSTLFAVYATTDGGSTWNQQTFTDPIIAGTPGCIGLEGNISLRFADATNGWMSSAVACLGTSTRGALVWKTTDGGSTWVVHQLDPEVTNVAFRIQVTGPSQMRQYATLQVSPGVFENGLIASNDGGASFSVTQIPVPLPGPHQVSLTFSDSTHGFFLTSISPRAGQVWRTSDGGATWQESILPSFATSAGPVGQLGYEAIYSPDGTNIWVTGSVLYFVSGAGEAGFIEKSSDGGATWSVQLLGSGF